MKRETYLKYLYAQSTMNGPIRVKEREYSINWQRERQKGTSALYQDHSCTHTHTAWSAGMYQWRSTLANTQKQKAARDWKRWENLAAAHLLLPHNSVKHFTQYYVQCPKTFHGEKKGRNWSRNRGLKGGVDKSMILLHPHHSVFVDFANTSQ